MLKGCVRASLSFSSGINVTFKDLFSALTRGTIYHEREEGGIKVRGLRLRLLPRLGSELPLCLC